MALLISEFYPPATGPLRNMMNIDLNMIDAYEDIADIAYYTSPAVSGTDLRYSLENLPNKYILPCLDVIFNPRDSRGAPPPPDKLTPIIPNAWVTFKDAIEMAYVNYFRQVGIPSLLPGATTAERLIYEVANHPIHDAFIFCTLPGAIVTPAGGSPAQVVGGKTVSRPNALGGIDVAIFVDIMCCGSWVYVVDDKGTRINAVPYINLAHELTHAWMRFNPGIYPYVNPTSPTDMTIDQKNAIIGENDIRGRDSYPLRSTMDFEGACGGPDWPLRVEKGWQLDRALGGCKDSRGSCL